MINESSSAKQLTDQLGDFLKYLDYFQIDHLYSNSRQEFFYRCMRDVLLRSEFSIKVMEKYIDKKWKVDGDQILKPRFLLVELLNHKGPFQPIPPNLVLINNQNQQSISKTQNQNSNNNSKSITENKTFTNNSSINTAITDSTFDIETKENPEILNQTLSKSHKSKQPKTQIQLFQDQGAHSSVIDVFLFTVWNMNQKSYLNIDKQINSKVINDLKKCLNFMEQNQFMEAQDFYSNQCGYIYQQGSITKPLDILFEECLVPDDFQFFIETVAKYQNSQSLQRAFDKKMKQKAYSNCQSCKQASVLITRTLRPQNYNKLKDNSLNQSNEVNINENSVKMPKFLFFMLDVIEDKQVRYEIEQQLTIDFRDPSDQVQIAQYELEFIVFMKKINIYTIYYKDPFIISTNDKSKRSGKSKKRDKASKAKKGTGWFYYDNKDGAAFSISQSKVEKILSGVKKSLKKEVPFVIGYKRIDY
ncbi:UNKNOWN [Stylonychia lemnae]|uniref:Uncharacterized protein n=1 Tax=Stylonychia lemnae TaxID=5949 RepID=A0A078ADU2_STYLE|nr:UNKNOWN [Stylonychia lemnae]|eukprot:CDW80021.1 UNKNOWN [Stylonychia lemnae]